MAKKDAVVLESGEKIESIGPWTIAWRKFKQNRVAMTGLIVYVLGKKERGEKIFNNTVEMGVAIGLVVLAVISIGLLATGIITI